MLIILKLFDSILDLLMFIENLNQFYKFKLFLQF